LIDFLLEPGIAAANTKASGYPSVVVSARALLDPDLASNPAVYPAADVMARLTLDRLPSDAAVRARSRAWTRFVQNDY